MLEVRQVAVAFSGHQVLDALSLEIQPGTVAAVLGASGSGKTTLLRVVAGLQRPDSGSVWWQGQNVTNTPPHLRNFGLMFQDYALFPHRTVSGNVAFGLEMHGVSHQTERVEEVLEMVGLAGQGDRSVNTLSGGEQQRVGLARALAPKPDVLMLDEPLGALDRSLRDRLVFELKELFTSLDLTVLYVTHDQHEAFSIADDIVILEGGQVVQHDAPEDVWSAPATPFVAELLGMTVLTAVQAREITGNDDAPIALRPERATIDPDGSIEAVVSAVGFSDGHYVVAVHTPSGTVLTATSATRPTIGQQVNVSLDDDAVVIL